MSARIEQLREQGGAFAIADVARFAITGADRLRYLNGQVSSDLRKLVPGRAMQACVLSAKGKLDAVVWMWSDAMPADLLNGNRGRRFPSP